MIKKTIKWAAAGFVCGMSIGNLIAIIVSYAAGGELLVFSPGLESRLGSAAGALAAQTLLSGVIGAVGCGGAILYELDRPSLLAVSVSHFAMIMAVYFPVAFFLEWIRPAVQDIFMMLVIEAAAYTVVWIVMYARYKSQVRKMNEIITRGMTT